MLDSAEEQQVLQMNLLCSKAAGIVFRAVINTSLWMAKQTLQGTQAPGKEPQFHMGCGLSTRLPRTSHPLRPPTFLRGCLQLLCFLSYLSHLLSVVEEFPAILIVQKPGEEFYRTESRK